jgi:pimeloyl-ACP methyl ester carboxylesterase
MVQSVMRASPSSDHAVPGVVYCGGRGASCLAAIDAPYSRIPMAIAAAGFPVVDSSPDGGHTWGNDAALAGIDAAADLLVLRHRSRPDGVLLFAGSMGALGALSWASRNRSRVVALAATLPVVDLADVHDQDRGGFASEIETAYGGREGYADQVAGHNPAALVATLTGLRFKAWYSTNDPIASAPAVEAFVDALGPPAAARSLGPIGHSAGTADPEEIVEHFRRSLGDGQSL